ncbi:hypothetical protein DFH07DRAFT_711731, partial [Mycena maculata]
KLQEWLQYPPDMAEKQHETQKLHHEGTGRWFLDSVEFDHWKISENSTSLWIKGQSGTGKTVLSSTIIRELFNDKQRPMHGTAVSYFYFDFRDKKKQGVEMMLRSIILQLSAQSPHPYTALNDLYQISKGQAQPTYHNLVDVLGRILSQLGCTYVVLDALDECTEPHILVQLVSRLRAWTKRPLHVLLTSQPCEIFTKTFDNMPYVALEFDTTHHDINLFVVDELRSNPNLEHLSLKYAEDVATKVVEKSDGMFRLAACLLDVLSRQKLDPDINSILANLPEDLFGIYGRFLDPINCRDFHSVARVLRWLMFSAEAVTLRQLRDALTFDFSNPQQYIFDSTRRGDHVLWVCKWLQGLVTVGGKLPPMGDLAGISISWSSVVTLAHSSVADYILSDEFRKKSQHDLREGPAHTFLAQTCVGYLLYFSHHPLGKGTLPRYPLSWYAARHWDYHLLRCDDRHLLLPSTTCLLEDGSSQYVVLDNLRGPWSLRPSRSPLFMCIEIGYTDGVQGLIDNGADINARDGGSPTALEFASANSNVAVVRLLLENGANYGSALTVALRKGHQHILQLLLENSTNDKATGGQYGSALIIASEQGDRDVLQLLLENGADINSPRGKHGNPLTTALVKGHRDIVQLLLENGADVNTATKDYGSALWQAASERGHVKIQFLL